MKLVNIYRALKGQLPWRRFYRNFFITGNGWGLFSRNSHINKRRGRPKIVYATYELARRSAEHLSMKNGGRVVAYKCMFCDGFHIGNNRPQAGRSRKRSGVAGEVNQAESGTDDPDSDAGDEPLAAGFPLFV